LGTGIAAATATGMGYLTKDQWYPLLANLPASKPTPTTTPAPTGTANNPPIADFEYRPLYVKPCIGQEVKFHSLSRDPDGTALTSRW